MEQPSRWVIGGLALATGLWVSATALAQGGRADAEEREAAAQAQATNIDAQTGKTLNEAIELMNANDYAGAAQKIATLQLDRLSPYERGRVEQILASIAVEQEKYGEAREHLQKAIDSGGLNAVELDQMRYQRAVLYVQEDKWREGAAALEQWFKTAASPNSAAYYLLAPDKKLYWAQLSQVYVQIEDYENGLAVMQLANLAGLVTEDSEVRRLADLLLFNDVPYRCGQVLEAGIENKLVTLDEKLYEKLSNCWIAAGELDKSVAPLERAAELAPSGDTFVRLGELQGQREDWPAAIAAIQRGVDKGELKDPGNAQLWLGIAHYSQKNYEAAVPFFERARQSAKHRAMAENYLQAIRAQTRTLFPD